MVPSNQNAKVKFFTLRCHAPKIRIFKLNTRRWNMQVTTWNNGSFNMAGTGYGIRIPKKIRDTHFDTKWDTIILYIEDKKVSTKLKPTFWSTCNELRSKEIGSYLIKNGLGTWEKGRPHTLEIMKLIGNEFQIKI